MIFFPVEAESSQISILYQWDAGGMLYFACFDFLSKAFFFGKTESFSVETSLCIPFSIPLSIPGRPYGLDFSI